MTAEQFCEATLHRFFRTIRRHGKPKEEEKQNNFKFTRLKAVPLTQFHQYPVEITENSLLQQAQNISAAMRMCTTRKRPIFRV